MQLQVEWKKKNTINLFRLSISSANDLQFFPVNFDSFAKMFVFCELTIGWKRENFRKVNEHVM